VTQIRNENGRISKKIAGGNRLKAGRKKKVFWLKDILRFFFLFSHKSKLFAIFVDWPLERKLKLEILAVIFVLWRQSRVAKRQSANKNIAFILPYTDNKIL